MGMWYFLNDTAVQLVLIFTVVFVTIIMLCSKKQ